MSATTTSAPFLPALWEPIAGDYATADGWIRLHTNAPHHRAAAVSVLCVASRSTSDRRRRCALESAGPRDGNRGETRDCAAAMRSFSEWQTHPRGLAVTREPLIDARATDDLAQPVSAATCNRPPQGVRVLDLKRVLAGTVATRFPAGLGADVLRIDPPTWDEPGVIPDVTLGKRCARLDLRRRGQSEIDRAAEWIGCLGPWVSVRCAGGSGAGYGPASRDATRDGRRCVERIWLDWTVAASTGIRQPRANERRNS